MKKQFYLLLFFCFARSICFAHHIVGGEIYYTYQGPGSTPGTSIYSVTLRLFRNCFAGSDAAPLPSVVTIGVFDNQSPYNLVEDLSVNQTTFNTISLSTYPVCISSKPAICYQVATYTKQVSLTDNAVGYRMSFQTCCRLGSVNVVDNALNSTTVPGAAYECIIPGTNILPAGHNSSAVFKIKDTALVCAGSKFSFDFSAVDPDPEDSVSYVFTAAYNGGNIMDASNVPPDNPLYDTVNYVPPYTSANPLGVNVNINPATGLASGIAPPAGPFVVCVEANEWRSGILISSHRKDFILIVSSCNIPQATLNTSYVNCGNYNFTFSNQSNSILINSYYWDFGVNGSKTDTSTQSSPSFTYPDTGTYNVTLIVNRGEQCTDTALSLAKVYPGFYPAFGAYGNCINESYQFIDSTTSKYGVVNYWLWDFDSATFTQDQYVSGQNPTYKYADTGLKTVQLIVGSSEGCRDTISHVIDVSGLPQINVAFRDTLICDVDTLNISASSNANASAGYKFNWTPNYNISNTSVFNPYVFPKITTIYYVSINDGKGCANTDSVIVNVINNVTVDAGPDTIICKTDSVQLTPVSNALYFSWSPVTGLSDPNIEYPFATPLANTLYTVTASVGKCSASSSKTIKVAPYPTASVSGDTTICYGTTAQLHGISGGTYFSWSPSTSLLNASSLNPVAGPQTTTTYLFSVTDTVGCIKPTSDSVIVTVIPRVIAFAGNDTSIVANQPLQLNASGGSTYVWSPVTGLNNPSIPNPILTLGPEFDSAVYYVKVSVPPGCFGTDSIKVIVFKTAPSIFIPSAFTPNGDGKNDILKPILVGMKQLNFFRVYNRWGDVMFNTTAIGQGWDGTYKGATEASGTYIYVAEAVDYLGKEVNVKGTVVLIR